MRRPSYPLLDNTYLKQDMAQRYGAQLTYPLLRPSVTSTGMGFSSYCKKRVAGQTTGSDSNQHDGY